MKESELKDLLADLSLEEKIGQMLQLTGAFFEDEGMATGPMSEMNLSEDQVNMTGTVLSVVGAARLKKIQDRVMASQPHHIPMIFMADVINGFRTVFPIPLAQGCSFDPELLGEMARISAKESARAGLHATFSPMVDLVRDARWGRVMESTGEDVELNSRCCKAIVKGYQGEGVGCRDSVSACIKHFAAYGAPMAGRDYNQVELSQRSLMEDYLPAYKAGVDSGAELVMTSFNTLGRVPSSANKELMQGILRDEWGFDGVLISDWAAIQELIFHGIAEDGEEAAYLALSSGVDIDMMTGIYANNIKALIEKGKVPMEWVDACVYRILKLKNKLGLFENPYKDADEAYDEMEKPELSHLAFARKAAPETFVLLKNEDHILPLSDTGSDRIKSIAFVGPYMSDANVCGAWSLFFKQEENVTLEQALKERKIKIPYTVSSGCSMLAPGTHMAGFSTNMDSDITDEQLENMMAETVECAKKADAVVLAIGEHRQMSGEAGSRTDITVPEHQMELFRRIANVNKNVIVVNFSGRPLDLREISSKAKALLQVWFPGTETGHAVMDVLFGDANPSGRLAMSFPYNVGQVPVYYSELSTGRPYKGDGIRFASRYIDAPNEPLYPFGFGLDYTEYKYENLRLSSDKLEEGGTITVKVDITNIGDRAGNEVVQMYIQDVAGSVARPVRQLKDFCRISIEAGETKEVSFEINTDMLKFYDINMEYKAEPGEFKVYIGRDSRAEFCASFVL